MHPAPTGKITIYPPFTEYVNGDVARVVVVLFSLIGIMGIMGLAVERWRQGRRSASIFLVTLVAALVTNSAAMVRGLGRPPTWWIIALFFIVSVLNVVAVIMSINEVRRGLWRQ